MYSFCHANKAHLNWNWNKGKWGEVGKLKRTKNKQLLDAELRKFKSESNTRMVLTGYLKPKES